MADLTVGSWYISDVPPDWEVMAGYGIRRTAGFPSVFLFAQEPMPPEMTLEKYISKQMDAARVLFREPKIRDAAVIAIQGATEARQLGLSWPTADGRQVVQIQMYATDGSVVGNATFTTVEQELPHVSEALHTMMAQLRFLPSPPAAVPGQSGR